MNLLRRLASAAIVSVIFFSLPNDGVVARAENLVTNGSFESPSVEGYSFLTYTATSTFGGWTVAANTVDLCGPSETVAADGSQWVDLGGTSVDNRGSIYQDLNTTVGQSYNLQFMLAGNAGGDQGTKQLAVLWGDAGGTLIQVGLFEFITTGHSPTDMGWVSRDIGGLPATSSLMRLQFANLTNNAHGPAIDNVTVNAVPEPSTYCMALAGVGGCVGFSMWRRRNRA
jgi:choice-of-anchor C domain-containing protein